MKTNIQKGSGIERLLGETKPERENQLNVGDNQSKLQEAMEIFKHWDYSTDKPPSFVLTPNEINLFLAFAFEERETFLGLPNFIEALIKNSYAAGNNSFFLSIPTSKRGIFRSEDSCSNLKGKEERPLILTVQGDIYVFGNFLKFCEIKIQGNAWRESFYEAVKSNIRVEGHFGSSALDSCIFYQVGTRLTQSTFYVQGKAIGPAEVKIGTHARESIFKTPNRETLGLFKETVARDWYEPGYGFLPTPSGNKIIFVHPDGKEETVEEYY